MNARTQLHLMMVLNQSPIMLIGPHGVGKSAIVASIAAGFSFHLLDIRLSQYSEGDILGIPYQTKEGTTRFYPPDIFKIAQDKPCVLFLDELNRASKEVRQAVFQLADSRRLGSLDVHPSTVIVAACNPDNSSYQVHTLDPAELNRWFVLPFHPSVEEWIQWAVGSGIEESIIAYIESHPHDLDPDMAFSTTAHGPSRRSWTRLSNSIQHVPQVMQGGMDREIISFMAAGFLGDETGKNFSHFFMEYQKKGLFAKVLDGSMQVDDDDIALSLPADIATNGHKASAQYENDTKAIQNIANALKAMPKEIKEATMKSIKKHCVNNFVAALSVVAG